MVVVLVNTVIIISLSLLLLLLDDNLPVVEAFYPSLSSSLPWLYSSRPPSLPSLIHHHHHHHHHDHSTISLWSSSLSRQDDDDNDNDNKNVVVSIGTEIDPKRVLSRDIYEKVNRLVQQRSDARWNGRYDVADQIKEQIMDMNLLGGGGGGGDTKGLFTLILQDLPRSQGGGSKWKLSLNVVLPSPTTTNTKEEEEEAESEPESSSTTTSIAKKKKKNQGNDPTILQLAHAALGLAVSCSQTMVDDEQKQQRLDPLIQQAKNKLLEWEKIHDRIQNWNNNNNHHHQQKRQQQQQQQQQSFDDDDHQHPLESDDDDDLTILSNLITSSHTSDGGGDESSSLSCWLDVETTLRGRKAADAAFWFALAGVLDQQIFDLLALVTIKEIKRFGFKDASSSSSGCRPKDIIQMLDRFSAATSGSGAVRDVGGGGSSSSTNNDDFTSANNNIFLQLEKVAQECLQLKQQQQQQQQQQQRQEGGAIIDGDCNVVEDNNNNNNKQQQLLDLHSDRCLLMLWKFSARQKKQQSFLQSARIHWEKKNRHHCCNTKDDDDDDEEESSSVLLPSKKTNTTTTTTTSGGESDLAEDNNNNSLATTTNDNGVLGGSQQQQQQQQRQRLDWNKCFQDPTRPLVIDLGCGYGVSLLGLASLDGQQQQQQQEQEQEDPSFNNNINILPGDSSSSSDSQNNFLGVDLSGLAIGYAKGVAHRWNLSDKLHFTVDSAESLLQQVLDSYPGPVSLCMIQFPTPYRLPTTTTTTTTTTSTDENNDINTVPSGGGGGGGNSQLPKSAFDGFMVSPKLLDLICNVLSSSSKHQQQQQQQSTALAAEGGGGKLLLQSNCEDVALWMQQAATEVGFRGVTMTNPRTKEQVQALNLDRLPQRTQNWVAMGGHRAVGDVWSASPLLPRRGSTETEVACRLNETPIHRCLLTPANQPTNQPTSESIVKYY